MKEYFTPTCRLTGRIKATFRLLPAKRVPVFTALLVVGGLFFTDCGSTGKERPPGREEVRKKSIRTDTFSYAITADTLLLRSPEFNLSELHGETMDFIFKGLFEGNKIRKVFSPDLKGARCRDIDFFSMGPPGKLYFVRYVGDFPLVYTTEVTEGTFWVQRFLAGE